MAKKTKKRMGPAKVLPPPEEVVRIHPSISKDHKKKLEELEELTDGDDKLYSCMSEIISHGIDEVYTSEGLDE